MRLPPVLAPVAAIALAVALSLVPAAPALAHARLIGSEPSAGATPETAPAEIVLEFNEPVEAEFGQLQVSGPDGTRLDQQAPTSTGAFVQAPIGPPTAAGTHTVAYRVLSADGHPVEGSFTYEVPESALPAATPEPTAAPEPTEAQEAGPTAEASPEPTPTATTEPTPSASPSAAPLDAQQTSAEEDGGLPLVPLLVGALLVVGVGGALLARRGGEPGAAA